MEKARREDLRRQETVESVHVQRLHGVLLDGCEAAAQPRVHRGLTQRAARVLRPPQSRCSRQGTSRANACGAGAAGQRAAGGRVGQHGSESQRADGGPQRRVAKEARTRGLDNWRLMRCPWPQSCTRGGKHGRGGAAWWCSISATTSCRQVCLHCRHRCRPQPIACQVPRRCHSASCRRCRHCRHFRPFRCCCHCHRDCPPAAILAARVPPRPARGPASFRCHICKPDPMLCRACQTEPCCTRCLVCKSLTSHTTSCRRCQCVVA